MTNPNNDKVAKKIVTFTCKDTKAPIIEGVKDTYVKWGEDYDLLKGISAKAVSGKNLTDKIKVVVTDVNGEKVDVENNILKCTELAEYTVKYSVSSDYGTKAEKTMKISIVESIIDESVDEDKTGTESA